jgi:hypothetical protein
MAWRPRPLAAGIVIAMLALHAADAVGQAAGGALTGVVRDESGALVPGAGRIGSAR